MFVAQAIVMETSFPQTSPQVVQRHKHTCTLCARRKVKCDKGEPCSNCVKSKAECLYEAPAPHRPRKRVANEELLTRLALYEALLRKHSIEITQSANTWVPSKLEVKLTGSDYQSPVSLLSPASHPDLKTKPSENSTAGLIPCLWSDLDPELKHPPVQSLRHKEDPLLHPTPSLQFIFSVFKPEIHELHPEPKHIYRLWQIFVETVNPLMKIIHVPTLQQRVLEASWDPTNITKPLTAILFAIYTLAVTSISSEDCQVSFGETRATLLTRYRTATLRALVAADFLTTKDFEVLQAFVLFLFADPESHLTSTLAGAAIRLGQKMGLHRDNNHLKISFFEKEFHARLWWQLHGLDSRNRFVITPGAKPPRPPHSEFGAVRLPLNINDADLHPDMTEPPIEQKGPTEMMCVLMKFELFNWLRSSPTVAKVFDNIHQGSDRANESMQLKDEAIAELEGMYREKYFRNLDKSIPLHGLTRIMGSLMIARTQLKAHHPRGRATASDGQLYMTKDEADMLFASALMSLEMMDAGIHSIFSSHLFTHMTSSCKLQMDPYIYVISELRRRWSGEQVNLAWRLVEALYTEHHELIEDVENNFFVALGDLTLEAWDARRTALFSDWESPVTPRFVQLLRDKRQIGNEETVHMHVVPDSLGTDGIGLNCESNLDWEYWNDFLTL